ncbi:hypothetical protein FE407_02150 [Leuconostoc carnosum]|uniref:YbbR-like protein n=2 Tax=Leuconostoc carnosum TaxID=1252 RepID=K0D968_LEUCJ|nr:MULTISPECIES: CdaR family protein [Leuconostoc]AFT81350.1 hypothetical protein C270_02175 [Leuconostoc carnosum JB16]KAA8325958.1 hypothetical protein FE404_02160 [Leuconostoc carnosum]KAA8330167.1 hypothetical protein FE409_02195 [Leuconostoc carnosum]KAA8362241.1 hypothetical protein FE407_02150 [Leuconostoc carnosum]KAA8366790.1 hypothetical protein FE406_02150 [Leuconostoc carnosum]
MKQFGQSKIVNLVISLIIAILLSTYVLSTKSTVSTTNGSNNFSTLVPEKKATLNVGLNLQFDKDKYVVINAPETVKVGIEGSVALVSAAQSRNDIQASADLRGLTPGKHTVDVALRGVNASLTSTINPQKITVTIAEKTSRTFPIKVNYASSKIASGYTASEPTADPKAITVTGPKANIDAVTSIVAQLDLQSGTKETLTQAVKLVAVDKNGEAVEVKLNHDSANVTLNIAPEDSKKVTLTANVVNGDSDDYRISFDPKTVTAYGSSDILNAMDSIKVPVDVANINDKETIKVALPNIDGIVHYNTANVSATVTPRNDNNTSSTSSSSTSSSSTSSADTSENDQDQTSSSEESSSSN